MNPQAAPSPQLIAGIPLVGWIGIGVLLILVLVLFHMWAVGAAKAKTRADAKADAKAQAVAEARLNRALRHPEPTEPPPLDYVRNGLPVPVPRSSAKLAQQIDQLEARLAGGDGGAAIAGVPTRSIGETLRTLTPAATATEPGPSTITPSAVPPSIDQVIATAAKAAEIKLPPPPTK